MRNFIVVKDQETIKKLTDLGFKIFDKNNSFTIFVNNEKINLNFSETDMSKLCYTNNIYL